MLVEKLKISPIILKFGPNVLNVFFYNIRIKNINQ